MYAEPFVNETLGRGEEGRQAVFLELLAGVYDDLEGYVRALVVRRDDSEDVLQETCVALWAKFGEYEFGTSFRKWAFAIAFFRIRSFWRDRDRHRGASLSDATLNKLAQLHESSVEIAEIRSRLLDECLGRLPSTDRRFVREVYFDDLTPAEIATRRGTGVNAVYTRLSRVRRKLAACIERGMT